MEIASFMMLSAVIFLLGCIIVELAQIREILKGNSSDYEADPKGDGE